MARRTLRAKLAQLPLSSGCYLFKDTRGKVLYVGKAKALRHRVLPPLANHDAPSPLLALDETAFTLSGEDPEVADRREHVDEREHETERHRGERAAHHRHREAQEALSLASRASTPRSMWQRWRTS